MIYVVTEHTCKDHSRPYELDRKHAVEIRFVSTNEEEAIDAYMVLSRGLTPQTPQGAAMFRSADYYAHHEVALLALEEGAVSALACPVIHEYYYE
jgi:hypothetical protein